jgi:hypothetical protein
MFKIFIGYCFIFILTIVVITHFLKIVYILFKPKFLEKFKTFSSNELSGSTLILYYLLTLVVAVFSIIHKFESL